MTPTPTVGLCASCTRCKRITSTKGGVFYLCGRAAEDPAFPKYPQLPVIQCAGYTTITLPGACESQSQSPRGSRPR